MAIREGLLTVSAEGRKCTCQEVANLIGALASRLGGYGADASVFVLLQILSQLLHSTSASFLYKESSVEGIWNQ